MCVGQAGVRFDLFGSAVCTSRLSVQAFDVDSSISDVERNDCPLDAKQGYADMVGVLLLFLLLLVLGKAQDKAAEYTDTQVSRRAHLRLHKRVSLYTCIRTVILYALQSTRSHTHAHVIY